MTTTNMILPSPHALYPVSPHTVTTPALPIENTENTLSSLSSEKSKKINFTYLTLLFGREWIIKKKAPIEKECTPEKQDFSETIFPIKKLQIPLEIVEMFLKYGLFEFKLKPDEIIRVIPSDGKLAQSNWLILYKEFDWLYPETVSTPSEFRALVEDAHTYGGKTFEQIFAGFRLLKRIQENSNTLTEITFTDLEQAGIYIDKCELFTGKDINENSSKRFLKWIQTNPEYILMCLRWVPAQNSTPDLLTIAVNHGNLTIVETIFDFIDKHHITNFNAERALESAILKANIPIAEYLLNTVGARIDHLSQTILHYVATIDPSLKVIKWLIENGIPSDKKGSATDSNDYYEKTAADVAISWLALYDLTSSSTEFRENGMNQLHIVLYLIDKGVPFNTQYQSRDMTLLHAACYAEDIELGLKVARLLIEKDPDCINTLTQDENAFTPLYLAFKQGKYRLMELFLAHGADATVRVQGSTVIDLARQLDDEAFSILQKTGNSGFVSKHNLNWVYPKWVSTRHEYDELTKDAVQYGQRNFEQIFEGLNILRLIKLVGLHAPITFQHLERAGIVQKGFLYPEDIEASEKAQNAFVEWIRNHPAHLLAFLRWIPVQRDIPHLYKQDITSPIHAKKAFKEAVENADLPIAHYLLDRADIHPLPINSLHIAAGTGSLEMVKLLINHNMLLSKKGIGQGKQDAYRDKTAAEVAISAIAASYFSSNAPQAIRDHGVNLVSTACYLLQEGQKQDISFDKDCTPTDMTLLHAASYAPSKEEGLWLAQWAFDQNPTGIHAADSEGRTPLYRAIQQKRSDLIDFLLNNGAQANLSRWDSAVLRLNNPEILDQLQDKKKARSIHSTGSNMSPTLSLTRAWNRIWTLLIAIPWLHWGLLWRPYAFYLAFFQEFLLRLQRPQLIAQKERASAARTVSSTPFSSASFSRTDAQSAPESAQILETPLHERYFRGVSLDALSTKGATFFPAVKTRFQSFAPFMGYPPLANDPIPVPSHCLDENTPPPE